jgi:putative inorganic carbon (hco3(-)) transporter
MRGFVFFLVFVSAIPLIFVSPFYGVLIWYIFSFGNFHTMIWGPFAGLNYAYVIAICTLMSWIFSRKDRVQLPMTPLVVLTLLFMLWITITSWLALGPPEDVWREWSRDEKILFMCLVGYALTTTRERIDQLIWAVILPIGFWGVKGAILGSLAGGVRIWGPDEGFLADNNALGLYLLMIFPFIFYQWHFATNLHLRRGLMLLALLLSVAVVLTYSRGAFLGGCAMGTVLWLRSRAKFTTGLLVAAVVVSVYTFAPDAWFKRMATIETYQQDGSAASRIELWKVSMRIAELYPITGGGFRVTFWPVITNDMLRGTDLPKLTRPRSVHSIYFDALSEHGFVGLALFVTILVYSFYNCAWLMRRSRNRPDLAWANMLGRMGQAVLAAYATTGTFISATYFDEYWCIIFILDAARRVVARATAPAKPVVTSSMLRPHMAQTGVGPTTLTPLPRFRFEQH